MLDLVQYLCKIVYIISFIYAIVLIKKALNIWLFKIKLENQVDMAAIINDLDTLITDCIKETHSLESLERGEVILYINGDLSKIFVDRVAEMIKKRLSEMFIFNLSLVYDEDSISEVIGEKIHLAMTLYVMENNRSNVDPKSLL